MFYISDGIDSGDENWQTVERELFLKIGPDEPETWEKVKQILKKIEDLIKPIEIKVN